MTGFLVLKHGSLGKINTAVGPSVLLELGERSQSLNRASMWARLATDATD